MDVSANSDVSLLITRLSVFSADTKSACLYYNAEHSVPLPNNGAVLFRC